MWNRLGRGSEERETSTAGRSNVNRRPLERQPPAARTGRGGGRLTHSNGSTTARRTKNRLQTRSFSQDYSGGRGERGGLCDLMQWRVEDASRFFEIR